VKYEDIKEVYSHTQAIGQCSLFFEAHGGVKPVECENTAIAAQKVAKSDRTDAACICSPECAALYGLAVLDDHVQNNSNNYTRFICIAKDLRVYPGADRISLLLSVMTAFVAVGSVAEGVVCSKWGILKTLTVVLVLYALGFTLLALGSGVYVALVCLALGASALGTLMPVVVRQLFGGRDYAAIWSVVISCSSVASFLATPVWGMVYDICGNYTPALVTMPVLLGISVVLLIAVFRKKN